MERKIGEIFEHDGDWYQCVKDDMYDYCKDCAFFINLSCKVLYGNRDCWLKATCKKLEKVGKPFERHGYFYQEYKIHTYPLLMNGGAKMPTANGFAVIIKQNKEDMEEKKLNLKPFDLEKAKAGKPVCTRDGRKVRIICFDKEDIRPIVALIKSDKGGESAYYYYTNGMTLSNNYQSVHDLVMLPEKEEGWVNVYKGSVCTSVYPRIYKSREEAVSDNTTVNRIDTVKIEWEE